MTVERDDQHQEQDPNGSDDGPNEGPVRRLLLEDGLHGAVGEGDGGGRGDVDDYQVGHGAPVAGLVEGVDANVVVRAVVLEVDLLS